MKKVLALVLALAMAAGMSTVALAADHPIDNDKATWSGPNGNGSLLPGEKYSSDFFGYGKNAEKDFSITAKWTKGGAMVKSVKIDEGKTVIELNENYTLEDAKDLYGKLTVKAKKDGLKVKLDGTTDTDLKKGDTITVTVAEGDFTVSNMTGDIDTYDSWEEAEDTPQETVNNTVYTADGSGKAVLENETSLIQVRASLKDEQKVFMVFDEKTVYDVIDALDEKGTDYDDLAFYNVKGRFTFGSGRAEVVINSDFSKKPYIYEWNGSKLSAVKGAKWNDGEGTYTAAITGPTQYVLSNKALVVEKEESSEPEEDKSTGTTTNPDTGANDFVGLAVALAVVSAAGIAVAKKH